MSEKQALHWKPHVVFVDRENRLKPGRQAHGMLAKKEVLR
jgi:aspartate 1-decarboxylase